jgi:nickel-dependent lactate racemase
MDVNLKYGERQRLVPLPETAEVSVLKPAEAQVIEDLFAATEDALQNPVGSENFEAMLHTLKPRKITIAVPDETRAVPLKAILPVLLRRLTEVLPRFPYSAVTIIVGAGLHPPDGVLKDRIVPKEIAPGCRVVVHDAKRSPMVDYGQTFRGTPVKINMAVAEADLKIVVGQIDPHQFVGFTGGAKGVAIGCAAAETIEKNHGLMFHEKAAAGVLKGNPVREDIDQIGNLVGLDLAVNVVLDPDKRAVRLLAGDPKAVLMEGAKTCGEVYSVKLTAPFDIAVASCGGYPKDICLYQAQKGLNLASRAVKTGGRILLFAECAQGVGDDEYLRYVRRFSSPRAVMEDFEKTGFRMGAHKAFLFSRTLVDREVRVVSAMDPELLKVCHLAPGDPETTLSKWVAESGAKPRIAVIPNANTTFFSYG